MALVGRRKLILDVRYGTYELYDLEADPRERHNLADEDAPTVEALDAEIRAWLDALAEGVDPHLVAIHRGRARDREAEPALVALLEDAAADAALRAEAARLLGRMARTAPEALADALGDPEPAVAREAAIALGRLRDERAGRPLAALARDAAAEPALARRVALSRGWLGDPEALPGLIATLDPEVAHRPRRDAVHLLGNLGDPRAVEPLLALLEDPRLRRRAAIALGRIGDRRALEPLVGLLEDNDQSSVRDAVARALGQIGDPRGLETVLALATAERLPAASESLVRLGAIGDAVGGLDVAPDAPVEGLAGCRALPPDHEWVYLARTRCRTVGAAVTIPVEVPAPLRDGAALAVRLRRADAGHPAEVEVLADGARVGTLEVDGEWSEPRLRASVTGRVTLRARDPVRLELDHVLLLPSAGPLAGALTAR